MMPASRESIANFRVCIALAVVAAVAVFFRFYNLDALPPFLDVDEAVNGVKARYALATGEFSFFYKVRPLVMEREPFGHEGLYVNLVALSLSIFGDTPWAIRATSAAIGVLTVLGLYLLSREFFCREPKDGGGALGCFNAEVASIAAAFFLSVSLWHTIFSRMGFNAILTPCVASFAFYFLFKALLRTGRVRDLLLGAFFLGLTFHTYLSNRVLPFVVIVLMALWSIERALSKKDGGEGEGTTYGKGALMRAGSSSLKILIAFWVVWLIVASPIISYFFQHPGDFFSRARDLSIQGEGGWFILMLKNFAVTLGQFNVKGDPFLRHNLPGATAMLWPVGLFFLLGVAASLKATVRFIGRTLIRAPVEGCSFIYPFLLIWLIATLAPAFLSDGPHPHAHRSLNAVLPAHLLAGLGAAVLYSFAVKNLSSHLKRSAIALLSLIVLLGVAAGEYKRYFLDWASEPDLGAYFSEDLYEIAGFINGLPPDVKKFVVVNFYGPQPVQFLTDTYLEANRPKKNLVYLKPGERISIDFFRERPYVVIPLEYDKQVYALLRSRVPGSLVAGEHFDFFTME